MSPKPNSPLDGVDLVLADLDGVIYKGADAIPHAIEGMNLAGETARWAAAGVGALLKLDEAGMPVRAAAERLAEALEKGLGELGRRLPD